MEDYGVTALGIFGSTARDEAGPESDVDVIVRVEKPDLFGLVHIREALSEAFGVEVDLLYEHKHMRPFFLKRLKSESIYV
jgi:predicted nucleotidyltransferase